jgi:zinc protease
MLRLRLIEVLREEEGAAYSPGLTGFATELYPDYAYSGVIVDVAPDDIDKLYGVIDKVTGDIRAGEFDADLLNRARKPILESFETSVESNGYWLGVIARAVSEPENLESHLTREELYQSITADELKPYAQMLYDPAKAVRIHIRHGDIKKNKRYAQ